MFGGDIGDGVDSDGVCVSGGVDVLVFGVIGLAPLGWLGLPHWIQLQSTTVNDPELPSHCCSHSLARSAVRHPRV